MRKFDIFFLSLFMVLTMILGFTSCGEEEVTLSGKTVNGLSVDVPNDFGEFAEKQGVMVATNEESTASIAISAAGDSQGTAPADWEKDSYAQMTIPNYTDVNFIEFDTEATVSGAPAVYAHFTAKNSSGVLLESYNYIIYLDVDDGDDMFQSITFSFSKDSDSSLKATIGAVKNSLKIA